MHLPNVNTKNTLLTINTNNVGSETLTNPQTIADEGEMKDKWLQVRVDDEIEQMLADLRKAEDDLPGKSKMVLRLIERAHKHLTEAPKK